MQLIELHVSQEILALVPEPSKESLELLKKSIKQHGQHEPIVAWKEPVSGKPYIVDGHSRYKVCRKLGIEPKVQYKNFDGWTDAMLYAIQVNGKRRHLCDLQKVELALREIEVEKKLAKERQMKTHPKKGQKGFQNLPNGTHTGDTCTLVSMKTGLSPRTVARHKKILKEGSEELRREVILGKKSPATAEHQINLEKIHTNPIPLPDGKYDVIVCDAPYAYNYEAEGAPCYPTLTEDEIINLKDKRGCPITNAFVKDAVMFFWAPMPKLEEALRIIKAWGFSYKTSIVWSKEKEGRSQQGPGHYVVGMCELVLVATRGKPGVPSPKNRLQGLLRAAKTRVHSQKPEMLQHWIQKAYPNRRYLELFARKRRDGWTVWGDQIETPDHAKHQTDKKGTLDDYR